MVAVSIRGCLARTLLDLFMVHCEFLMNPVTVLMPKIGSTSFAVQMYMHHLSRTCQCTFVERPLTISGIDSCDLLDLLLLVFTLSPILSSLFNLCQSRGERNCGNFNHLYFPVANLILYCRCSCSLAFHTAPQLSGVDYLREGSIIMIFVTFCFFFVGCRAA